MSHKSIIIAPSILSADFSCLGAEITALEKAGADWIHVDVMDGVFVPNLSFGAPIIKSVRKCTKLPFDVHLMVQKPLELLADYVSAGSNSITIHVESDLQGHTLLEAVRIVKSSGVKVGISFKPSTPVDTLADIIQEIDIVLIMTVEPGFGGQSFMENQLSKIEQVKQIAVDAGHALIIQVDGGIKESTISSCAKAGANCFVAGSAILSEPRTAQHYQSGIAALKVACK